MQVVIPFTHPVVATAGDPDGLRPYQREAVTAIGQHLGQYRSTLVVAHTGAGKTQIFGVVAKHWKGRVLVLAHRDELIQQAARRLYQLSGEVVGVEKAEFRASGERLVVSSVQTLSKEKRLRRWAPEAFSLVIVDEAHHAVADTYQAVLRHFERARVLGVTATPDRADMAALGKVFDSVAYKWDIADGIKFGSSCRYSAVRVDADAIDLTDVRTTAGDLNQGDLEAIMSTERALHQVVVPTMELAGARKTIVFCTSVDVAHRTAEIFCRYRPGCAKAVDGKTDADERRQLLADHAAGKFQFLCNVAVLTEGYDDPTLSCVAMARPTKSRALYTQMAGRGGRPVPGKADCLLIDFVGNCGRHSLISATDMLGGNEDDDVLAAAKKKIKRSPMDPQEAIAQAKEEKLIGLAELKRIEAQKAAEKARREMVKARAVAYSATKVDPFAAIGAPLAPPVEGLENRFGHKLATEKQRVVIQKLLGKHYDRDVPRNLTARQASKIIEQCIDRRKEGLATYSQARFLATQGIVDPHMTFTAASKAIDAIMRRGPGRVSPEEIKRIIYAGGNV